MQHVKEFMQGDIGLIIKQSSQEDVDKISEFIESNYEYYSNSNETLAQYFRDVRHDNWEILVYEPDMSEWNAYRNDSAKRFEETHWTLTASEILNETENPDENCYQDINEKEIMNLFN